MASTGLGGPYALTDEVINRVVSRTSPGAYAVGHVDTNDNTFYVEYVGRSDDDVNNRLHRHVGNYSSFKFGYFSTKKAAFEKECRLYHDFNPPDNKVHPARPAGTDYSCPVPGCPY
jgi:hypothetical protein